MLKVDEDLKRKITLVENARDLAAIKARRFEGTFGAVSPQREDYEAFDAAVKAMRKRDPKIPKQKDGKGQCPVCNRIIPDKINYCGHCGQALDWRFHES